MRRTLVAWSVGALLLALLVSGNDNDPSTICPTGRGVVGLDEEGQRLESNAVSRMICSPGYTLRQGSKRCIFDPLTSQWFRKSVPDDPFRRIHIERRSSIAFADLNRNGVRDLFVTDLTGDIRFYRNTGKRGRDANFLAPISTEDPENPFHGLDDIIKNLGPTDLTFADLDADGDLDALICSKPGNITLVLNEGNRKKAKFVAAKNQRILFDTQGLQPRSYCKVALVDIDGDGDLDAFVSGSSG